MLFDDYRLIEEYLFFLKNVLFQRPKTLDNKRYVLRSLARFLDRLGESFLSAKQEFILKHLEGRAANSVYTQVLLERKFFKFLRSQGLITQDPTADLLHTPESWVSASQDETVKVQAQLQNMERQLAGFSLRDETMFRVFYFTGIRTSELAAVQIKDINFRKSVLIVNSTILDKKREVSIPLRLEQQLKKYLSVRCRSRHGLISPYLFPDDKGGKLHRAHIYEIMNGFLKLTCSTQKGAKVLRASFALRLKKSGVPKAAIRKILG